MLDKLMSGTAGFVQNNLTMIGNSYPVTLMKDKVRDIIGWKKSEETGNIEDDMITDTFDNAPTQKPSDYISIYSMIERAIKGEKIPIYRWVWFGIGIVLTGITIMMVTNHMIMLPWSIRLFAALYILNIGLFADFTQTNLIYFVLLTYLGLFLYRAYLQTMDSTMNIVPFYTFGFLPLRTKKNNWTDAFNSIWLYLLGGASGPDYNAVVRATEDYMDAQKAAIPDYDTLAGTFGLEPLYETFENHLINMNLPGFIPLKPDTSIQNAQRVIDAALKVKTDANAKKLRETVHQVQDITTSGKVIDDAKKTLTKALAKSDLTPGIKQQLEMAQTTLKTAASVIEQQQIKQEPKPTAI